MRSERLASSAFPHMIIKLCGLKRGVGAELGGSLFQVGAAAGLALALVGCAPQTGAVRVASKEYFPESIYGRASPRLVDGGPIPRGGGQYLVGRPYSVAGRLYIPHVMNRSFSEVGLASWYGDAFHGRRTANGEIYDKNGITAAHPTMPLPSYARITNLRNGHSIVVRVNDRGPYHPGRVMDVSSRVADALDFKRYGTANVRVDYVGPASLSGSDDRELLATLRTDGQPAVLDGSPDAMVASSAPLLPFGSLLKHAKSAFAGATTPYRPPLPRRERRAISLVAETTPEPDPAPVPTAYAAPDAPMPPPRPFNVETTPGANASIRAFRARQADGVVYSAREMPKRDRDNPDGRSLRRRPIEAAPEE